MTLVTPTQSNPDDEIRDSSINDPVNELAAVVNGNIDDTNISSVSGSKIANATVTNAKLSTAAGELGGAWQSWTPTWTNLTVGNGTQVGRYIQIGKNVIFRFTLTFGSTTSVSSSPSFALPVTATSTGYSFNESIIGNAAIRDASPSTLYFGLIRIQSTTATGILLSTTSTTYTTATGMGSTTPITWASGDIIVAQGIYEAA